MRVAASMKKSAHTTTERLSRASADTSRQTGTPMPTAFEKWLWSDTTKQRESKTLKLQRSRLLVPQLRCPATIAVDRTLPHNAHKVPAFVVAVRVVDEAIEEAVAEEALVAVGVAVVAEAAVAQRLTVTAMMVTQSKPHTSVQPLPLSSKTKNKPTHHLRLQSPSAFVGEDEIDQAESCTSRMCSHGNGCHDAGVPNDRREHHKGQGNVCRQ